MSSHEPGAAVREAAPAGSGAGGLQAAGSEGTGSEAATPGESLTRLRLQVVVPTRNGGEVWKQAAAALAAARDASRHDTSVLVVDTASTDGTAQIATEHGFTLKSIAKPDFDHGGTRNAAVDPLADVVVFLTQDAIMAAPDALDTLVAAFNDAEVAVAYGRQLPHRDANPIATHAREFNYPAQGRVVSMADAPRLGLKTVFTSNSFAAYRVEPFLALGGFPAKLILSEDMFLAARAVLAGHRIAYVAEAAVRHSHNYSPWEEAQRYFDIGVFQGQQQWIAEAFGGAGGEGRRYLQSELRYLLRHAPLWLPRAALHNALKIVGYKLGKSHGRLPMGLCRRLSMHKGYWGV